MLNPLIRSILAGICVLASLAQASPSTAIRVTEFGFNQVPNFLANGMLSFTLIPEDGELLFARGIPLAVGGDLILQPADYEAYADFGGGFVELTRVDRFTGLYRWYAFYSVQNAFASRVGLPLQSVREMLREEMKARDAAQVRFFIRLRVDREIRGRTGGAPGMFVDSDPVSISILNGELVVVAFQNRVMNPESPAMEFPVSR